MESNVRNNDLTSCDITKNIYINKNKKLYSEEKVIKIEVKKSENLKKKGWSKFYITVEPLLMAYGFCSALTRGLMVDYLQTYICQQNLHLSMLPCESEVYSGGSSLSGLYEETSNIIMYKTIVEALFPLFICVFVGPWSDTNGRKPYIVLPTLGFTFYFLIWSLMALTNVVPVYFYILPSLLLSLSGSSPAFHTSCINYVCDNSLADDRAIGFSFLTAISCLSNVVGTSLSGTILYHSGEYGYQILFFTCSFISALASLYAIFILEETVEISKEKSTKLINKSVFKGITNVFMKGKNSFEAFFVFTLLTGEIMCSIGDENISYLVGKSQFSWSLYEYNLFSGIATVIGALCHVAGVWLIKKKFKLSNRPVITMLFLVMMILQIVKGFSVNNIMFFISAVAYSFFSIVGSLIDDELFKLVPDEDVGKASAILAIVDCLSPVLSTPMYTQLYNLVQPVRATYVYFLSAALLCPAFITSAGLIFSSKSFIAIT